ncbi:MAG: peptidoglycan editing factor PgeF [Clostridiales bacterium]|nr:peptidoglycan editing factor PgeF [Clostridiales bacterium]
MEFGIDFGDHRVNAGVVSDVASLPPYIVTPCQTHSCHVAVIDRVGDIPELDETDAIISLRHGVGVAVRTADCVPILLYAPDIMAVAAIHAGWKGSLNGIVNATVLKLFELGADPKVMKAAFGPSICGVCYEVSLEMAHTFSDAGFGSCIKGTRNLDLQQVNIKRLLDIGLMEYNIKPSRHCTFETVQFPSWRRRQSPQRLATWILYCETDS